MCWRDSPTTPDLNGGGLEMREIGWQRTLKAGTVPEYMHEVPMICTLAAPQPTLRLRGWGMSRCRPVSPSSLLCAWVPSSCCGLSRNRAPWTSQKRRLRAEKSPQEWRRTVRMSPARLRAWLLSWSTTRPKNVHRDLSRTVSVPPAATDSLDSGFVRDGTRPASVRPLPVYGLPCRSNGDESAPRCRPLRAVIHVRGRRLHEITSWKVHHETVSQDVFRFGVRRSPIGNNIRTSRRQR